MRPIQTRTRSKQGQSEDEATRKTKAEQDLRTGRPTIYHGDGAIVSHGINLAQNHAYGRGSRHSRSGDRGCGGENAVPGDAELGSSTPSAIIPHSAPLAAVVHNSYNDVFRGGRDASGQTMSMKPGEDGSKSTLSSISATVPRVYDPTSSTSQAIPSSLVPLGAAVHGVSRGGTRGSARSGRSSSIAIATSFSPQAASSEASLDGTPASTQTTPTNSNHGYRDPNNGDNWITTRPAQLLATTKRQYMKGLITINGHRATYSKPSNGGRACKECSRVGRPARCEVLTSDPARVFPRSNNSITPQSPYHRCSDCVGRNCLCSFD